MQNKNILIIDSANENCEALNSLFNELNDSNILLSLVTQKGGCLAGVFTERGRPVHKAYFGKLTPKAGGCFRQMLGFPFLVAANIFLLLKIKRRRPIDLIICIGTKEKLMFTPAARALGIRTGWMELPESAGQKVRGLCGFIRKLSASSSEIFVFTSGSKNRLSELGIKPKRFIDLAPTVKLSRYQDTIFENIAHNDQHTFRKKFFTLGTILDLDRTQKLEYLFQAVKTSLTVIPNLQLVVVGDGKARKELLWLAKKMQIDNLVWFVGEQQSMKKWLSSFDIYISAVDNPRLKDLNITLAALSDSLPVICPLDSGFEDMITDSKTGALIDMENVEMLARQIIKLYKDPELRKAFGKNAKEFVDKSFTIEKIVEQFISSI
jgi:glycosyltransferase involved in cell wall biosynthesis